MEESVIKTAAEFVFGGLAVILVIWLRLDSKEREEKARNDAKEREEKLMAHNEGYQKALTELSAGQQQLASAITEMRADIDKLTDVVDELR